MIMTRQKMKGGVTDAIGAGLDQEQHRMRILHLCDRLADLLGRAERFDMTADGEFLWLRVEGVTGREVLRTISSQSEF